MKTIILTIIAMLAITTIVPARDPETLNVRLGASETAKRGKLTIKFLSIVEDSRCPVDARCIWAGNAKIKIAVAKGKTAARTITLNTGPDPRTVSIYGYDITLVDLTPHPGEPRQMMARPETAKFSIKRSGS